MTRIVPEISIPKIMIAIAERQLMEAARRSPPKRRQRIKQAVEGLIKVRVEAPTCTRCARARQYRRPASSPSGFFCAVEGAGRQQSDA